MIDQYGIHLGPLYIRFYGIIIMLGVVIAATLANRRAAKYGQDPERVWDILTWAVIGGVLGARLWHVLTPSPSMVAQGFDTMWYLNNPLEILMIWKGGLGIVGAVAGGALALYIYVRANHLSFLTWTDIIAPGLILAQAIGRWGNYVNQELYGAPTNLPWAVYIDEAHRLPQFANEAYYHPTFLYESILNLIGMGLLIWIGNRYFTKLKPGDLFLVYLIYYPIVRFFMEILRLDSSTVGGLNANQAFMVIVMVLAAITLFARHRFFPPAQQSTERPVSQE